MWKELVAVCMAAAYSGPGYSYETEDFQGTKVVAHEIIVKFKSDPAAARIEALIATYDIDAHREIGRSGFHVFHSRSLSASELVTAFEKLSDVLYVHPDHISRIDPLISGHQ